MSPGFTKICVIVPGGGGGNGGDRLFVLQFKDGLVLGDRVALFDEQVHHGARISAFTKMRKFQVHNCSNKLRMSLLRVQAQVFDGFADHAFVQLALFRQRMQRGDDR